ncbi:MAG TPA: hypothetical protein VMT85_04300 [Thermoanaerobaculia bacterium]|nr:hypothetical protein [Thermoanaerobaculia bacterium]
MAARARRVAQTSPAAAGLVALFAALVPLAALAAPRAAAITQVEGAQVEGAQVEGAQPRHEQVQARPHEIRSHEMRPLNGPRGDVAALLLGGADSGALRVAALAVPDCAAADGGPRTVTFWVELEAQSLLEAVASRDGSELPESIRLELYAYAMTRGGEIAASLAEWVRLGVGELTASLPGGGAKLVARLELLAGEYQLRVLVREPSSQHFALRVLGLEVPGSRSAGGSNAAGSEGDGPDAGGGSAGRSGESVSAAGIPPFLAPPRFADAGDTWLLVGPSEGPSEGPRSGWRQESLSVALPVLSAGRSQAFAVRGCHLAGARLEARVADLEGRPAGRVAVRFEDPGEGSDDASQDVSSHEGHDVVPASIELPALGESAGLSPGIHRLEISATTPAGRATVSLPFFLAPPGRSDRPLPWTALGSRAVEPAARDTQADADATGEEGAGEVAAIASAYREALGRLALGRREEALESLLALQSRVLDELDGNRRAVKRLDAAQNRVTRELLEHHAECLLPLLVLHLEVQDHYQEADGADPFLLEATRSRIRALAQVYAEEAESGLASSMAALSLVEMARALERAQQRFSALVVLREAIALDPANPEALLELAFQFESHGFEREALTMLERLLELQPRSDEGRLRQAMSLARANRHQDAAEILRRLIRDGATEWVLAVAYQELGHFLLRQQEHEEAVRLLREGVGRLPRVQRLYLELAYALDRAGRRDAARAVVLRLPEAAERASPRLRYRVPGSERDSRSRDVLLRYATARLPLLSQALSASAGGGSR